jgi:hypothetical protein
MAWPDTARYGSAGLGLGAGHQWDAASFVAASRAAAGNSNDNIKS